MKFMVNAFREVKTGGYRASSDKVFEADTIEQGVLLCKEHMAKLHKYMPKSYPHPSLMDEGRFISFKEEGSPWKSLWEDGRLRK